MAKDTNRYELTDADFDRMARDEQRASRAAQIAEYERDPVGITKHRQEMARYHAGVDWKSAVRGQAAPEEADSRTGLEALEARWRNMVSPEPKNEDILRAKQYSSRALDWVPQPPPEVMYASVPGAPEGYARGGTIDNSFDKGGAMANNFADNTGVMALPEVDSMPMPEAPPPVTQESMAAFEQMRQTMPRAEFGRDLLSSAQEADPAEVQVFLDAIRGFNLPPDLLDALNATVDAILAEPQRYADIRAEVLAAGAPEELFPEQFDPEYFAALNLAIDQLMDNQAPASIPSANAPQGFARGGIADMTPIAREIAKMGRNGDTMLAHINPQEAALLKRYGGSGTINPHTGLREYGWLSKAWKAITKPVKSVVKAIGNQLKSVVKAVKSFAKSTVGKIVLSVALGFFLGPAAAGMLGVTSSVGVAAVGGFIGSAGSTLLAGGKFKDALKAGVTGAVMGGVMSGVTGGSLDSGTYAGPQTVGAQWDKFNNSLNTMGFGSRATQAPIGDAAPSQVGGSPVPQAPVPHEVAPVVPGTPNSAPIYDISAVGASSPPLPQGVPSVGAAEVAPVDYSSVAKFPQAHAPAAQVNTMGTTPAWTPPVQGAPSVAAPITPTSSPYSLAYKGAPSVFDAAPITPASPYSLAYNGAPSVFDAAPPLNAAPPSAAPAAQAGGSWWDKTKQFIYPENSAAELVKTPEYSALIAKGVSPDAALKAVAPGALAQYGPAVGIGLTGMAALGGFTPKEPPPSALEQQMRGTPGTDLINANPSQYLPQNLPGVAYDARGNITGGSPWTPYTSMSSVQVATPSIGSTTSLSVAPPPTYAVPQGGLGYQQNVQQPYNTGSMYDFMRQPVRRAASGGIASLATGGYPRRNGQINGPGTATSDSIPAMLSDGEFVMTAQAVRGIGGGSRRAGAKRMYALMHQLERNAARG